MSRVTGNISPVSTGTVDGVPLGSTLPPAVRGRLVDLFGQIVQEFEVLYAENEALHQQLGEQSDRLQGLSESSAIGTLCMILGSQLELQRGLAYTTFTYPNFTISQVACMEPPSPAPAPRLLPRLDTTLPANVSWRPTLIRCDHGFAV